MVGSTTTNRHGVAALHFATVPIAINWLLYSPTHARGGTLDLLITDVPALVRVVVVAPIGNSDHFSLSAVISVTHAVTVGKFSLNIRSIVIQFVVHYTICPGLTFDQQIIL